MVQHATDQQTNGLAMRERDLLPKTETKQRRIRDKIRNCKYALCARYAHYLARASKSVERSCIPIPWFTRTLLTIIQQSGSTDVQNATYSKNRYYGCHRYGRRISVKVLFRSQKITSRSKSLHEMLLYTQIPAFFFCYE